MKKFFKCAALIGIVLSATAVKAQQITPTGYWDQYSDKGQLQSIVQIWQDQNELKGRIIKGFPVDGKAPNHYCTNCTGIYKDKRITDLTFIWGLKYNASNNKWEDGHILDPQSGHIYQLTAKLDETNQRLFVRAYLGITLLGRSQVWQRITDAQMKQQLLEIKKVIGNS